MWNSSQNPAMSWWLVAAVLFLLLILWGLWHETNAVQDHTTTERIRGQQVLVHQRYIRCRSQRDAYNRAFTAGGGREPIFHHPHRQGERDQYYHYHASGHTVMEGGQHINYHYYWVNRKHKAGGSRKVSPADQTFNPSLRGKRRSCK